MRKLPLIIVEWDDTSTNTTWRDEKADYIPDVVHCISVGWKIKASHKHIIITPMRSIGDGYCSDRQIIPRGCVTSVRRIE